MKKHWMILCMACSLWCCPASSEENLAGNWTRSQINFWRYLIEELEISELHFRFSQELKRHDLLIQNVTVIPMADQRTFRAHSVEVCEGFIRDVKPSGASPSANHTLVIDGTNHFLMPGLIDMHVHNLESNSQYLLNLAFGVTAVRDMDGFHWMIRTRNQIDRNQLVAPKMFVSGTILNQNSFGGYAKVVRTTDEARRAVRDQKKSGFDFIKTHNNLSADILDAIGDESKQLGLDVVGHIPVGITVRQAVNIPMRTFEHFKGYIIDSTLTLSEEDCVAATKGADVWNTPTFVTYRNHLRGNEAKGYLADDAKMRFVSPRTRQSWHELANQPLDQLTSLRQNIFPLSKEIFRKLRKSGSTRFLSGTDSGALEMLIPGIALHEELQIFVRLGMTPFEALQTATVNPAGALRSSGKMGVIKPGARADLILLTKDPLEHINNTLSIAGVVSNGIWISKDRIDSTLGELTSIFASTSEKLDNNKVTATEFDDFLSRLIALAQEEFVFRDHYLELAAQMFEELERRSDSTTIRGLKTEPDLRFDFLQFK